MERPARAKARELAGDAAPRNCEGRPSCRSALGPATVLKGRAAASERAPGTVCRDGQGANRSRRVGNLSGQPGGLQEGERLAEFLGPAYGEVSPDGIDHFKVVATKIGDMAAAEPDLQASELAKVTQRSLVMFADDDLVTP